MGSRRPFKAKPLGISAMHVIDYLRLCTALITLMIGSVAVAVAQSPAKTTSPQGAAATNAHKEITWDQLVPKNWDPTAAFKEFKLDNLKDGDPRAAELLKKMRSVWDNAPANPALQDAKVKIPGFLVPLEETPAGLKEFLLVPYFGACIHTPPPPANQIIHVLMKTGVKGFKSMDTVWVSGTLSLVRTANDMGASGYHIDAVKLEPYTDKPPR